MVINKLAQLIYPSREQLCGSTKRDLPFVIAVLVFTVFAFPLAVMAMRSSSVAPDLALPARNTCRSDMFARRPLGLL